MLKNFDHKKSKKNNMKKAVVADVFLWMVILAAFAGFFFFVINYKSTLIIKKNIDELSAYGCRMVAAGEDTNTVETRLNNMILDNMNTIAANAISCSDDGGAGGKSEVIFNISVPYNNKFFPNTTSITATSAAYNDDEAVIRTCNLQITLK